LDQYAGADLFFDLAISIELFEIGPQIVDLLGVGDAGDAIFVPGTLACGLLM
jgi:hypothetical protein